MKKCIIVLISIFGFVFVQAQNKDTIVLKQNIKVAAKAQHICLWGDTKRMELHPNGKIYQFKDNLEDGKYTAFFDKKYKDTAMVVVIENGELNGLLQRWDDGELVEECEYKNGLKNGWRKLYFYTKEHGIFLNIQKCEDGACIEVHTEW
ncbi:MAG: hypothetical protein CVU05_12150 [Bacteroidetes bacterium HGW-Bacteroidetes-21]|nr:MAG: hypothetical protein CVU05_12150 [Bacteroidetes bacterium HGW-Bacteroidetes-21]